MQMRLNCGSQNRSSVLRLLLAASLLLFAFAARALLPDTAEYIRQALWGGDAPDAAVEVFYEALTEGKSLGAAVSVFCEALD